MERISPRRFPAPWSVEELEACFIVQDANVYRISVSSRHSLESSILLNRPVKAKRRNTRRSRQRQRRHFEES
jgi:hypothetical protein